MLLAEQNIYSHMQKKKKKKENTKELEKANPEVFQDSSVSNTE